MSVGFSYITVTSTLTRPLFIDCGREEGKDIEMVSEDKACETRLEMREE